MLRQTNLKVLGKIVVKCSNCRFGQLTLNPEDFDMAAEPEPTPEEEA